MPRRPVSSTSLTGSPSTVSVATTSSASSSTPLTPRLASTSPKDYAAAFGLLQSQYGWGPVPVPGPGPVPSPSPSPSPSPLSLRSEAQLGPPKEKKRKELERRRETRSPTPGKEGARRSLLSEVEGRDFEGAFGSLVSRFGFGGGSPRLKSQPRVLKDERR
ncbi:hypothetical protein C8Q79DRAFT_1008038 [Trametes meyenii]|nr:hypothetical protein C8Q79DRAFT_1008038 [Trametes meyenii]